MFDKIADSPFQVSDFPHPLHAFIRPPALPLHHHLPGCLFLTFSLPYNPF